MKQKKRLIKLVVTGALLISFLGGCGTVGYNRRDGSGSRRDGTGPKRDGTGGGPCTQSSLYQETTAGSSLFAV